MNKQEAIGLFKLTPMTQEKYDKDLDNANGTDVADVLAELYVKLTEKYNEEVKDIQKRQRDLSSVYDFQSRQRQYQQICKDVDSFIHKDMFNQPELTVLLDKIAEVTVKYIAASSNTYNVRTPALIKQVCFMTCYLMYDTSGKLQIITKGEYDFSHCGIQTYVMKYLHDKTKALGHKFFVKENVVFTKDQWGISPRYYVEDGMLYVPEMPFKYAGCKDDMLGYIVRQMLLSIEYEKYVDVFAGSGSSVLQLKIKDSSDYTVNDLNHANYCFYQCMKDDPLYQKFMKLIVDEQKEFLDLQEKYDKGQHDETFVKDFLRQKYQDYLDVYEGKKVVSTEETAVCFVMFHNMLQQGKPPARSYKGSDFTSELRNDICRWIFERDFAGVHNIYKRGNVSLLCQKDSNLISSVPDSDKVVLHLDPPYIATAQYAVGAYNYSDLIALLDSIKAVHSKKRFIYHCQTFYNASASKKDRDVFKQVMSYWNTFDEDLWVTFYMEVPDLKAIKSSVTADSSLVEKIDAFLYMSNVNKNEYYLNWYGKRIKDTFFKPREIIITNFEVSINPKYYAQDSMNPYNRDKSNSYLKDYIITTVPLKDYLIKLLPLL